MEITMMQMYWLIKLDMMVRLFGLIAFIFIVLLVASAALFFSAIMEKKEELSDFFKKIIKIVIPLFILFTLLRVFTPTTKQACAIIIVPKIINNEQVQEIPNKVLELGIEWLDELKPEKE